MDQFEALVGIGQLGVAISGFAGIVMVLGRNAAYDEPANRVRLSVLVTSGLSAGLFSLLPQILWGLVAESTVWALSSAVWFVAAIFVAYPIGKRVKLNLDEDPELRERHGGKYVIFFVSLAYFIVLALQAINVIRWQNFQTFFLALSYLVFTAVLMFARILHSRQAA